MPSEEDQLRACNFLAGEKRDLQNPRLRIYRTLLRSVVSMTSQQICDTMGGGTNSNNVSSKLNYMRRCGLVEVSGQTRSDISGRPVAVWRAVERVPLVIEFHPPASWYLAIDAGDGVVQTVETDKITREEMVARHPGRQVLRAVEADSE